MKLFREGGPLARHPKLSSMVDAMTLIGPMGMSDDEMTDDDSEKRTIMVPHWRSFEVNTFIRALDQIEDTFLGAVGATPGRGTGAAQRRTVRVVGRNVVRRSVPKGLHQAAYDRSYLEGLSEIDIEQLEINDAQYNFIPDVDLLKCVSGHYINISTCN